jgi:hypothetical protein
VARVAIIKIVSYQMRSEADREREREREIQREREHFCHPPRTILVQEGNDSKWRMRVAVKPELNFRVNVIRR